MANSPESRNAARAAIAAYQAHKRPDGTLTNDVDDETALHDLMVDLAHLADTFDPDETSGEWALTYADTVYHEEVNDPDPYTNQPA